MRRNVLFCAMVVGFSLASACEKKGAKSPANSLDTQNQTFALEITKDTWLKDFSVGSISADNIADSKLKCKLPVGSQLVLNKKVSPTLVSGHYEIFINSMEDPNCHVKHGFIFKDHVKLSKGTLDDPFGDIIGPEGLAWGRSLAAQTNKVSSSRVGACAIPNDFNRGDCYECAALAMAKALGEDIILTRFPELNTNGYARDFSDYWNPSVHEKPFGLKRVWKAGDPGNGEDIANKAPVGSVIVWSMCGRSPAGHISIVTDHPGYACSSFCAEISNSCSNPSFLAVFYPIK